MIPLIGCKNIVVFGLGLSGKSVLRSAMFSSIGAVYACDDNPQSIEKAKNEFQEWRDKIVFCTPKEINWNSIDTLILSPGVPLNYPEPHDVVKMAREHNCTITVDIEMLWRAEKQAKFIGITGTNGKSTTTKLVHDILKDAGYKVEYGGNIGMPALNLKPGVDFYVLELSSFQLDLLNEMNFDCSIILNITPDHLNRYESLDAYAQSKLRIFTNKFQILSLDSEITYAMYEKMRGSVMPISSRHQLKEGVCIAPNGELNIQTATIDIRDRQVLLGKHNEENICAATAAAVFAGVQPQIIKKTIINFVPLDHRAQIVGKIADKTKNITFINDSKATTPESTECAILAYQGHKIFLILGGQEKYKDSIKKILPTLSLCEMIYLIGETSSDFARLLEGVAPYKICVTMERATHMACDDADDKKVIILLSPACASFDQWSNFEERGNAFAKVARDIMASPSRDDS